VLAALDIHSKNKRGMSDVENLSRYVDDEKKSGI
jgi:hypothetical protein